MTEQKRPLLLTLCAIIAILFGVVTLKAGGSVLFIHGPARAAAGDYVPFVLWFNFIAGFFYIVAGVGTWRQQRWSMWLAGLIAIATLLVFTAFGIHIQQGGNYEMRTVYAMTLRSTLWLVIATTLWAVARSTEVMKPLKG